MAVLLIGSLVLPVVRETLRLIYADKLEGYKAVFLPKLEDTPFGKKAVGEISENGTGRKERVAILYLLPGTSAFKAHPRMGYKYEESVLVMPPADLQLEWLRKQGVAGLEDGYLAIEDAQDVPLTDMRKIFFVPMGGSKDLRAMERLSRALLKTFVFPPVPSSSSIENRRGSSAAEEPPLAASGTDSAFPSYG